MIKELTTRQWDLYNFLKDNYDDENYISKSDIVKGVIGYEVKDGETRYCRDIEFDVHDINSHPKIPKIIVSCHKGYKIGNPKQVHDYLWSREIAAKESLVLTYKMRRKAELNNQYRITFGKSERNVIEAYLYKEEQDRNDKESKND
jgi:hypothetical protein